MNKLFCTIAISFLLSACSQTADLTATNLRTEYKTEAVTDKAAPSLSWELESSENNQVQTAYQIIVASSPDKLSPEIADLWNSEQIPGSTTYQVKYKGKVLSSGAVCYWKVRSWDKNNNPGKWSVAAK